MIGPEPLAALYAACEAIARGEVGEIEIDWAEDTAYGEHRLSVVVRREVRHLSIDPETDEDNEL
jgi:hypothetical protein